MVALIDAQRNTPILMVHHLTSGVAQQLSITVPVDGFQAVYSKLEAIEAIISYALVVEDKLARDLREQWPFDQVQHDVGLIKDDLANQVKEGKADARQVAYLQAKAEFILSRLTA
jgi:hypothetical protein